MYPTKAGTNMPHTDQGSEFFWYETKYNDMKPNISQSPLRLICILDPAICRWRCILEQTPPTRSKPLLFSILCPSLRSVVSCFLVFSHAAPQQCTYTHIYFYVKSQNLTSPTRSLPSLALNGHRYGNNCLAQNLERHLAQIMKEEMQQHSA